jgi:hypothetical protein
LSLSADDRLGEQQSFKMPVPSEDLGVFFARKGLSGSAKLTRHNRLSSKVSPRTFGASSLSFLRSGASRKPPMEPAAGSARHDLALARSAVSGSRTGATPLAATACQLGR